MKTGLFLICLFLLLLDLFLSGCCDQTFILHRGEKILVDTGKSVQEYHHIYETNYVPVVEQPQPIPQPKVENLQSSAQGRIEKNQTTLLENPDQRMITFEITSDYPGGSLQPDSILMNGKEASPNNIYDLNSYEYIIQKNGYYRLQETIPSGKEDVSISKVMQCKPREIRLNITDEITSNKIACEVFLQSQKISEGSMRKPGASYLKIQAEGYQSYEDSNFVLPIGEGSYEISKSLKPVQKKTVEVKPVVVAPKANITLQLKITSDFPKGEEIFVDSIMVSDKEMGTGDTIDPGKHRVVIRYPGYEVYQSGINVPSGVSPFVLQAELVGLPRAVETLVTYDVSPGEQQNAKLGPCQVYLSKEGSSERIPVQSDQKVKPGRYELLIRRTAYNDIVDRISIYPSSSAYKIHKTMEAKARMVQADVDFDIDPPGELESHLIDFIDIDTKVPRAVRPGGSIKPGKYNYMVNKPGYQMLGGQKPIVIEPDEDPFGIKETLQALPRQLTFESNYQGQAIRAREIRVDNQLTRFDKLYPPGKYRIEVTFDDYQPIQKDIVVSPGVGPFVVPLTLEKK